MIPHAEKLIERAQRGEKLNSRERRHCVEFLEATRRDMTQTAMADLFKVTERQIRFDKQKNRKDVADRMKEDDPGLVVADIAIAFENQVKDIERSKNKCKLGSRVYLEHCKTLFSIQLQKVKALQDLGILPKNLGNMTMESFAFQAIVTKAGVQTGPAHLANVPSVEILDMKPLELEAPSDLEDDEIEDNA